MSSVAGTVLVVDDDAAVRAALKFALEVEGFRVQLYDGPRALLADHNLPEWACLVIDYRMPEIDGIELVDRLRSRNVMLPVILISGRVSKHLRSLAQRSGLTWILEKPLSDAALVESIRGALALPTEGRRP
ncbi:Response regulator receiver domain-containing protein [Rhodospirillales bacterium URHD0017]|nr:Response regulator receiver domain-containing protein [Rhodospirillales bacterium URHD0017]